MHLRNYIFLLRIKRKISSTLTENETWSLEGSVDKTLALRAYFWRFSDFKRKVSNFGHDFFSLFQMLKKLPLACHPCGQAV